MGKKIIGIAGNLFYRKEINILGLPFDSCNNFYSQCISLAGGIPLYLPVISDKSIITEQVNLCDGILLPGGNDLNPLFYNELPINFQGETNNIVDIYQFFVADLALKLNKNILGICRGHQLLTIATGGSLYQDISCATEAPIQHNQISKLTNFSHPININKNSLLYSILGDNYLVNSAHHQCIQTPPVDFTISATAPDGIIEGIEKISNQFLVGVQWHPECLSINDANMINLFKEFVNFSYNS